MDYKHRNDVLWHWCIFTFATSLIISLVLTWFEPWGWTVPTGSIWVVPQIIPTWLAWPIVNTLFILTFVWMKTNRVATHKIWTQHPITKFIRAFVQGLMVACFCGFYSLVFLIIASVVLSTIISFVFAEDFYNASRKEVHEEHLTYNDYDDEEGISFHEELGLTKYSIRSGIFFFYALIVTYALYRFGPDYGFLQIFASFFGVPFVYLISTIVVVLGLAVLAAAVILLIIFAFKLWGLIVDISYELVGATIISFRSLSKAIKWLIRMTGELKKEAIGGVKVTIEFFADVFGDALLWILVGILMTGIFSAWCIYALCFTLSVFFANFFHWLFPPRQITTN